MNVREIFGKYRFSDKEHLNRFWAWSTSGSSISFFTFPSLWDRHFRH